jgi:hypothetical protein
MQTPYCVRQFLENDEPFPYSFFIGDHEIHKDLYTSVSELGISTEKASPPLRRAWGATRPVLPKVQALVA